MQGLLKCVMTALLLTSMLMLSACVTRYTPGVMSELKQGKRDFDGGYYKRAMRQLLPLACDGIPEAQYAVGYMYYYGFGPGQDPEVGAFWIGRSAAQNYQPAVEAMKIISHEREPTPHRSNLKRY